MRFLLELDALRLQALSWEKVLRNIETRLSPADFVRFQRLHSGFVHYRSPRSVEKFYGFIFSHALQDELLRFRRPRLERIGAGLFAALNKADSVLEVGAGSGIWGELLKRLNPEVTYAAYDACAEAREFLRSQGFEVSECERTDRRFGVLLCADSLGEENSDEDAWLAEPKNQESPDYPDVLEERYGIIRKLKPWSAHLQPGGRLLLWEPFPTAAFFEAMGKLLRREGWSPAIREAGGVFFVEARSPAPL